MASESAPAPINGNYATGQSEGSFNTTATPPSASGKGAGDIPQDEVGWYFVEQYYTTLSRSPEKLFLFYNKRSQFVSGVEEEKVSVCIGQKSINERIKELDFQDCKVRITNVDSQGSDDNIVIQVIGEISNKHAPHRKFVQTFVLAGQTNGYFVLNDVFRYILDEEPEIEGEESQEPSGAQESAPAATDSDEKGLVSTSDSAAQEASAAKVDEELEEVIKSEKADDAPAQVNGTPVPEKAEAAEESPVAVIPAVPETPASATTTDASVTEETKEPEKPKDPEPTKAAPTPKASPAPPAVPVAPPKPAAPKTWASLAASANRVAMPVVPTSSLPSTAAQTKPAPASQAATSAASTSGAPAPAAAAQTPAQSAREPSPGNSGSEGWQTAGQEHSKRQSRAGNQAPTSSENAATRAYIKNVYENVDGDALKKELARFGEIAYFDVSRQKNCAFVDFTTLAGFQAAVAANPHTVGDSQIFVEERRLRPGSFAFQRGGGVPRGRGDRPVGQGRGNFKQDGNARGGFQARGRGAPGAARGRGASQAA